MKAALTFFCLLALLACTNEEPEKVISMKDVKEDLMDANRILRQKESDAIDAKVRNLGWAMTTTGTGLRYLFVEKGTGDSAVLGSTATMKYRISLLETGDICYSSDSTGPIDFVIGRDYVETGLHEAIQLMRVGDKAIFILPSHLAHGLLGDWEKIPPLAPVVYQIELTSVRK